jgi:membrane dipeptidase
MHRRDFVKTTAASAAALPFSRHRIAAQVDIDELFDDSMVIDTLAVAHRWDDDEWAAVQRSGYTAIQTTLSSASLEASLRDLTQWSGRFRDEAECYLPVTSTDDIRRAKAERKLGVILGFQNATQLGSDLGSLDALYELGTRNIQLTYNSRNLLGDGCTERTNAGLSDFGVAVVERMGELGIMVDLSHCGVQTSRDGIRFSRRPPAFTHTMCQALYHHPRAKGDDLLRALADRGGVVGIAALGYFVGPDPGGETTIERYLDHIQHAVNVCGIEHVGLSTDFQIRGIEAWATRETWYEPRLRSFKPSYNVRWPPWIPELDEPERFRTVAHGLARRRFGVADIERILGLNWTRCLKDNLGA